MNAKTSSIVAAIFVAVFASVLCVAALAQDSAKKALEASPRHHEWVEVAQGERKVRCFVAFPEVAKKAPAVLVIHENKGLTDWVRSVADQLAAKGFLAIAPDLLSGAGPEGGDTTSFASTDAATKAIYALAPEQVKLDLDAAADYVLKLEACDGKLSVAGFCWGGSQSFNYAAQRSGLRAAFVFYGGAPTDEAVLAKIQCPVYGFYGENDARITGAVPATVEALKKLEKRFEPTIYAGAGHGFVRAGEASDASEANKKAREEAWKRWVELLGAK
jgi:carboxymethylenebutenolidase